jgi:alkylation response protein AidB-like acyl-CoA dehydrogenase
MRISDSPEEASWRSEVRNFLDKELPDSIRIKNSSVGAVVVGGVEDDRDVKGKPEMRAGGAGFRLDGGDYAVWREKLAAKGWIAPAWPKEYGGAGLSTMEQFIMNEEFAEVGAPQLGGMGVSMAGPTIIVHGTEEQKKEHLPKILKGETWWCQGFSEPGSGSDLASLQTRAVRDGDDFIINGSKIWTSGAQRANWMFMLARTDPEAPKHRGISYFLMDFTSPGISLQPLVQMSGQAGFNQVFFDNVRVPAKNVVGEVNRGWYIGTTTLDFERSSIGSAVGIRHTVDSLIRWNRDNGGSTKSTVRRNPMARYDLVDRYIETNVARMLSYRVIHMQNVGQIPNMEASMAKLFMTELSQRVARTAMKTTGLYGLTWDRDSDYAPMPGSSPARAYVNSVGQTIAGGTSEIQRNIIAQRGLQMPRS